MNKMMMPSLVRACVLTLATAFLAFGLIGCAENGEKDVKAKDDKAACKTTCKTPCSKQAKTPCTRAKVNQAAGAPKVHQQPPTAQKTAEPNKRPLELKPDPVVKTEDTEKMEERKKNAEDMIYATIRIRMEEMIEQRAQLLKNGKSPSDPEVRQLEGSIMRARTLLIENGEMVGEINPPIVQRLPNQ